MTEINNDFFKHENFHDFNINDIKNIKLFENKTIIYLNDKTVIAKYYDAFNKNVKSAYSLLSLVKEDKYDGFYLTFLKMLKINNPEYDSFTFWIQIMLNGKYRNDEFEFKNLNKKILLGAKNELSNLLFEYKDIVEKINNIDKKLNNTNLPEILKSLFEKNKEKLLEGKKLRDKLIMEYNKFEELAIKS